MKTFLFLILILIFLINANCQTANTVNTLSYIDKLKGISSFWKEVSYNFINFNDTITIKQWDSLYYSSLTQINNKQNDYEYFRLMEGFASILDDEHTGVYFDEKRDSSDYLPLLAYWIDTSFYVFLTLKSNEKEIPIGSRIITIDNQNVFEYLDNTYKLNTFASTKQAFYYQANAKMFSGLRNAEVALEIVRPNGSIANIKMKRNGKSMSNPELSLFSPFFQKLYSKELSLSSISSNTCILTIPTFNLDSGIFEHFIDSNKNSFLNYKNIIIDLRDNDGGNGDYGLMLAKLLIKKDSIKDIDWVTRENVGAYKAWGYDNFMPEYSAYYQMNAKKTFHTGYLKNEGLKFSGNLVVLINAGTCSTSENLILYLKINHRPVTLIGEPSAGSTGAPLIVEFPGGYGRICAKTNLDENGKPFVRKGFTPDIEAYYSIDNIISGGDAVLDKAIEYLESLNNPK